MTNNMIYAQIEECTKMLDKVDMRLNDLRATMWYLAEVMGQYGDECSRVFSMLNTFVEDARGELNEAMGCAYTARNQIDTARR